MCERGEERASIQIDEHDVMSTNQTEKDGKDLRQDNDPLSPSVTDLHLVALPR